MKARTILGIFFGLAIAGVSSVDAAPSNQVDYVLITPLAETYCGQRPQNEHQWTLGGGGCLSITAATGPAGVAGRHEEQLEAVGWNNGPNGVMENGGGDDLSLGPTIATWSVETTGNEAHGGSFCLTDSPAGLYNNSTNTNATIQQTFDLTATTAASFEFWHRWNFRYSSNADIGTLQVRLNGGAWQNVTQWRYVCGLHGTFIRQLVDLTPFVGNLVEVRFNFTTSGSGRGDGWFIDDLRLLADGEALFVDDFESGTDGWALEGTWGLAGDFTSVVYLNRNENPVTFPVSRDQDGRVLATVSATGLVRSTNAPIPTGTADNMGYVWVKAVHPASGTSDAVMLRESAAAWVPE